MADHSTRIAEIQDVLRTGAKEVVKDGVKVVYDFGQLRRELRQLMSEDPAHNTRRPVCAKINLSGF
jgi:hypothetical protein